MSEVSGLWRELGTIALELYKHESLGLIKIVVQLWVLSSSVSGREENHKRKSLRKRAFLRCGANIYFLCLKF